MKAQRILVAGGAGFLGSHLCDVLIARGNFVIALDNLSTGSKRNIVHLLKEPRFKFVKGDVTKPQNIRVDEIYHLASPASPPHYQRMPIATWKANTLGTLNLLELATKNQAKLLYASTSEVYGDPKIHPQKEDYFGNVNPVGLRSCYDESKRSGEAVCADFRRSFKLDVKIVRIFNTYGPRMDKNDGRVVSNFIFQALKGKPVSVYGSGKQTRSFQYVDDLIAGLIKMMAADFLGPVNLGNPGEFNMLELAKKILDKTGSKSALTFKKLPPDDPKQRKPNIRLAQQKLGWQPKISLDLGLEKTIAYFKQIL